MTSLAPKAPPKRNAAAASRERNAVAAAVARAYKKVNAKSLTSTQLGKIGEGLVKDVATILSDGAFVFYPPADDNEGNDFIVKRRYRGADIKVQVKTRESQRPTGAFLLSIHERKLPAPDPKFIVVVNFVSKRPDLELMIWVIPSAAFMKGASFSAGQYQALLSPAGSARDRWVSYRHPMRNVAVLFAELLDAVERDARNAHRKR